MSRFTSSLIAAVIAGQFVGLLGWIDPIFLPLVLAGPLVTGAVAAAQGVRAAWIAVLWASAGVNMIYMDWLINREDVVFHAALSVIMAALSLAGWSAIRLAARLRSRGLRVSG